MEVIRVKSLGELERQLTRFRDGEHLFRGQTGNHVRSDGLPSIRASQTRKGCVPPEMRKWTHYASATLRYHGKHTEGAPSKKLAHAQALLQHYGWRSFFVDVTREVAVAAWFASHVSSSRAVSRVLRLTRGEIVATHVRAQYRAHQGSSHLYVFNRTALMQANVGVVDLGSDADVGVVHTRIRMQQASLLGPLGGGYLESLDSDENCVPSESCVAYVTAPAALMRRFSSASGYHSQQDLFPDQDADPILATLLSVPWKMVETNSYSRGLALPEYRLPTKRNVSREAFPSRNLWISRDRPPPLAKVPFFRVTESLLYATGPSLDAALVLLENLIRIHGAIVVETDALLMQPNASHLREYGKGVVVTLVEPDVIEIAELMIEHPGDELAGVAVNRGYHYQTINGTWVRMPTPGDCPCGDSARHMHLFNMVTHVADMIVNGELVQTEDHEMTQRELRASVT